MGIQFTDIGLITADVLRLRAFYERVFNSMAEGDEVHSTMVAGGVNLTFDHVAPLQEYTVFSYVSADSGNNIIVSFNVDDVDGEYQRLLPLGVAMLNQPTTLPWGARSFQFKDPDGNILNFRQLP